MNPHDYRRRSYDLTEEQVEVRDAFTEFFQKNVPTARVRAAEPLGFDADLWKQAAAIGVTGMAVPEHAGGDGAGLVEMTLVAEAIGRTLAPVTAIEHIVATRLLAATGDEDVAELLGKALTGERVLGLALRPLTGRQLVSGAAVAQDLVAFDGGRLVIASGSREHVPTQASMPFAWVDPAGESLRPISTVGSAAAMFDRAQREWKVLTAAALAGLTASALELAVEFVKSRETMGTIVGKLQGVQFPLADVHTGVVATRNLARRAAWFLDNEPDAERGLPFEAIAYAAHVASTGTAIAAHAQGGLGFIGEADASLYFLRAKGWSLGAGDVADDLRAAGREALAVRRGRRGLPQAHRTSTAPTTV